MTSEWGRAGPPLAWGHHLMPCPPHLLVSSSASRSFEVNLRAVIQVSQVSCQHGVGQGLVWHWGPCLMPPPLRF